MIFWYFFGAIGILTSLVCAMVVIVLAHDLFFNAS